MPSTTAADDATRRTLVVDSSAPAVAIEQVRFRWPGAPEATLDIGSLRVAAGARAFIHGPSGSGKSTLLALIGGILVPDAGRVSLLGQSTRDMAPARRDAFRADHVGVIFQQFNLLPYLSVAANVALPCRLSARRRSRVAAAGGADACAAALLDALGIDAALHARPARSLSVGQQQRVAAARALIGSPDIVIADEPTSALDHDRRDEFMRLLLAACAGAGSTLVFVSHDLSLAPRFDPVIDLTRLAPSRPSSAPASSAVAR